MLLRLGICRINSSFWFRGGLVTATATLSVIETCNNQNPAVCTSCNWGYLTFEKNNRYQDYRLLDVFRCDPIDEIILHPRSGEQMYAGTSALDAFEKALEACKRSMV